MSRIIRFLFIIGRIFSPLYSGVMVLRAFCYRYGIFKKHRLPVPVISIGNLTLGGTGKTPLVMYVVKYMLAMGKKPAIISRGYGGKASADVNVVSNGQNILLESPEAGDEPRLLAETLPGVVVLTGARRALTGSYAVDKFQIDSIVMDDGYQHLALERDLDLVLFSGRTLLACGWVFPGGRLREPFSALKRADGFVITGVDGTMKQSVDNFKQHLAACFPQTPVFMGEYLPVALLHNRFAEKTTINQVKDLPLYGFAGIADPKGFKYTLLKTNFRIVGFESFKDHYDYSAQDIKNLIALARKNKAYALITTTKDFVKLKPFFDDFPLFALKVELFMQDNFDLFLDDWLKGGSTKQPNS